MGMDGRGLEVVTLAYGDKVLHASLILWVSAFIFERTFLLLSSNPQTIRQLRLLLASGLLKTHSMGWK